MGGGRDGAQDGVYGTSEMGKCAPGRERCGVVSAGRGREGCRVARPRDY